MRTIISFVARDRGSEEELLNTEDAVTFVPSIGDLVTYEHMEFEVQERSILYTASECFIELRGVKIREL